jgi:DNA-binding transcriptional ArsR family regulator
MPDEPDATSFDKSRAELFDALGHPVRIRILQALEEGPLGFSELRRKVGLESSGHLQFHLGKLDGLVKSTEGGGYMITGDGLEAMAMVAALTHGGGAPSPPGVSERVFSIPKRLPAVTLVVILLLGAAVAYQTYAILGLESNVQNLRGQLDALYGTTSSSQEFPNGLSPIRVSPTNPNETQVAVFMMGEQAHASISVSWSIDTGRTANLAVEIMNYSVSQDSAEMTPLVSPLLTLEAIPSTATGPAAVVSVNVITSSIGSKGIYYVFVPVYCSGIFLAVGYNLSDLSQVKLPPISIMFSCIAVPGVHDVKIVGLQGGTLIYLPAS